MLFSKKLTALTAALLLAAPFALDASRAGELVLQARELNNGKGGGGGGGGETETAGPSLTVQPWMSPEIGLAWQQGWQGQGVTITVVDQFSGGSRYWGNLGLGRQRLRHGEWTYQQSSMIAPSANMVAHDFNSGVAVSLRDNSLNTLNLSYGMVGASGLGTITWRAQERSIIDYAHGGYAVVVKAAGNDSVAVGEASRDGFFDYLNRDLIGAQAVIFVGALNGNGTVENKTSLASYSNSAGADVDVQNSFLAVGVRGDLTNLYGTSFAAPIISGYAAVLGSKFTGATPTKIRNQLLNTARTDTIEAYAPSLHGKGEASIWRALAPDSIN